MFRHKKTRELAYLLWEKAGRPDGRDVEFWLEAETVITRKMVGPLAKALEELDAALDAALANGNQSLERTKKPYLQRPSPYDLGGVKKYFEKPRKTK